MNLSELKPPKGSRKKRFKKGRGPGSGLGKTAGRGQKGAGSRKSAGRSAGFEGGQMPLQRRVPKRGFNSRNRVEYQIVNLKDLEKRLSGTVTAKELVEVGLIKSIDLPVKVLGDGKLTKALQIKATKFSSAAAEAIAAAGGKAEVI